MKIDNKKFKNFLQMEQMLLDPTKIFTYMNQLQTFSNVLSETKKFSVEEGKSMDISSLSEQDIKFFDLWTEKREITINEVNPKDMQLNLTTIKAGGEQVSYKSINVSKSLFNLIEYSFKTQKPVRLDFQGDSSVILKVNQEGKLKAEFISSNAAMEYALKAGIPELRSKLDSQGLPYEEIYYRDANKDNNKQQNKKHKGGNK